jgi:hypothetical protein
MTLLDRAAPPMPAPAGEPTPDRQVGLARLRSAASWWAVAAAGIAALGQTGGTVIAGRLAESPTAMLVSFSTGTWSVPSRWSSSAPR